MLQTSYLFSVSSFSAFSADIYRHLYVRMTRILDGQFKEIAEDFSLIHVTLSPRKTQCLLTHLYFYFLDNKFKKSCYRLSDYYLKKHLCDMTYTNMPFPKDEFRRRIAHRFSHYTLRLELVFRSLLPDMLLSLSRLESHSANLLFRLREILLTFQH